MPLSENEIRNILALDDARLKSVIMQICDAVGADRRKAEKFASDPAGLRAAVSGMINRLLDKAGREKSEQVLDALRGKR